MNLMSLRRLATLSLWLAFMCGCGQTGPEVPSGTVSGQVSVNHQPLSAGAVTFIGAQTGDTATAILRSDGTYTLRSSSGDRIPAGAYQVVIVPGPPPGDATLDPHQVMQQPRSKSKKPQPSPRPVTRTPPLKAVIQVGANTDVNFDVQLR